MPSRSEFAVRFGFLAALLLILAGTLAAGLLRFFPIPANRPGTHFPEAFLVSTTLLLIGSVSLARARAFVRRERQIPFRQNLIIGLAAGTLFVATQSYALACLIRQQPPAEVQVSEGAFVAVLATLHAMHFIVALMCLAYITVNAFADRYDHEYYWGVTVCAWFWHILGIVWLMVLCVIIITSFSAALNSRQ
ncbi:MAG: cytochrome c oxidase subunit 3 [Planctomycetes bacterium]|nr:cytochrome c oxidase subunit 3 [Planctomycetota bacterium]